MRGRARFALLVAAAIAVGTAGCGSDDEASGSAAGLQLKESGVITWGANIAFAPFEFLERGTQEPNGFDVDLGRELAKRLDLESRFLDNPSFDALIPALQDGQYDAVLSAMTMTKARAREVDFTQGYLNADQALTVNVERTPDVKSVDHLPRDAVLGVQKNTTSSHYAETRLKDRVGELRTYDETAQVLSDLAVGRTQAIVMDIGAAAFAAKDEYGGTLGVVQRLNTDERLGIAVRTGNRRLVDALNRAIDELRADGTIDRLEQKWFGDLPGS